MLRGMGIEAVGEAATSGRALTDLAKEIADDYRLARTRSRLGDSRVVEQLLRLRTAVTLGIVDFETVRRRAASRERNALLQAATVAGLTDDDAQRKLVTAGAAAKMLGISRERLRQLAEVHALEGIKTSLGRVYWRDDLKRLSALGWNRRQSMPDRCSCVDCSSVAIDAWDYTVLPGISVRIGMCASHIAEVVNKQ
jgi:hypothetical protein